MNLAGVHLHFTSLQLTLSILFPYECRQQAVMVAVPVACSVVIVSELRPGFGKVTVLLATQETALCCAKEAHWLLNQSLKKYLTTILYYSGFLVVLHVSLYVC